MLHMLRALGVCLIITSALDKFEVWIACMESFITAGLVTDGTFDGEQLGEIPGYELIFFFSCVTSWCVTTNKTNPKTSKIQKLQGHPN